MSVVNKTNINVTINKTALAPPPPKQDAVGAQANLKTLATTNAFAMQSSFSSKTANGMTSSSFSFTASFGSISPPSQQACYSPAKKGLKKNPAGWPKGTVETPGGYKVVPRGGTKWQIYGPKQKPTDKPNTEVSGDPHVYEKDGTRWDFTKDSQFALPDGTRLFADTSAETGHSVSKGLTISTGNEAVEMTGLNGGSPKTGNIMGRGDPGAQPMFDRTKAGATQDTFYLGGSGKSPKWFRERDGKMDGEVTKGFFDGKHNRYDQTTNPNSKPPTVDRTQGGAMGSQEWAQNLGNQMASAFAFLFGGNALPGFLGGAQQSNFKAASFQQTNNNNGQQTSFQSTSFQSQQFGGMQNDFNSLFSAFGAVGMLGQNLFGNMNMASMF